MANIYKCLKRKNGTSDSALETISPEEEKEKSLCDEASHVDDAITHSPGEEDKIIEASDMTQSVASQLQLILCKLEALETKFGTVVTTVNILTSTVEGLKKTVCKVQWRLLKARQLNLGRTSTKWITVFRFSIKRFKNYEVGKTTTSWKSRVWKARSCTKKSTIGVRTFDS